MNILVIPSIRENNINEFFRAWKDCGDWDEVILIEDNPQRTFNVLISKPLHHYSWKEIDDLLGSDSWIISRKDSAIRCFGFLLAHKMGAEYILTLDDDCFPHGNYPIFASHIAQMSSHPKWVTSIPGMRTRGIPYKNIGTLDNVVINMGLWSGIPDFDAIQTLHNLSLALNGDFQPPIGSRIIPNDQYFPLCGMSLCFIAKISVLMYFPMMGQGQPYQRFDDIFCGIICKKIIDHLKLHISVGEPHIKHIRASETFENLIKEAPGIKANEDFWVMIDDIELTAKTPKECIIELGLKLESQQLEYFSKLGKSLQVWANLFPT